jgi:hypothetical protein
MERSKWFERRFTFDYPEGWLFNILERLRGTPIRLHDFCNDLDDNQLTAKPDGHWSIQEQVGHGDGRDFATVAGAAIGAGVGYTSATRQYAPRVREEVVQRCDVSYDRSYEERIEGYRVTYEYNGREYTTRMPYDPGERIKVRVAVAPAE